MHIARVRLANPKRAVATYPPKHNTKSTLFSSTLTFLSSPLRHAQQEWDAAHIARGRLGNQKREGPSYLSNSNAKSTLFPGIMDDINVYAANCVSGMWRAHIASGCCRPRCRMRGRSGTRRTSRAERFVLEGAR